MLVYSLRSKNALFWSYIEYIQHFREISLKNILLRKLLIANMNIPSVNLVQNLLNFPKKVLLKLKWCSKFNNDLLQIHKSHQINLICSITDYSNGIMKICSGFNGAHQPELLAFEFC